MAPGALGGCSRHTHFLRPWGTPGLGSEEVAGTKQLVHVYRLDLETCQVRRQSGGVPSAVTESQSHIGNTMAHATILSVEAERSLAWPPEGCLE